ncbi:MAG: iron-containing redox enzyme family protein [Nanoarchaeota archaeon]
MKSNNKLREKFIAATQAVKALLPQNVTKEQAKEIIARYTAAFEGNFVAWMAASAIAAQTVQGRYAAEENIEVEMRDNHPGMLRKFSQSSNAAPSKEHYEEISKNIEEIRTLVGELNGVKSIALMTYLENTSAVFIPYLAQLAKRLGCIDFTYTDVHGVADVDHADQFLWALQHEIKKDPKGMGTVEEVFQKAENFLRVIFQGAR